MNWPGFHDHERDENHRRHARGERSEPRFGDSSGDSDDWSDRKQEPDPQNPYHRQERRYDPAPHPGPDDGLYPHNAAEDEEDDHDRSEEIRRNRGTFAPDPAVDARTGASSRWTEETPQENIWTRPRQTVPRSAGGGRLLAVLSVLVAGGVFAGILWYSYGRGGVTITSSGSEPPLIHADQSPFKRRPEQPGGMDVPHQDKLVFDRLNPNGPPAPAKLEKLRPPPEAPLPRPAAPPPAPATPAPAGGMAGMAGMAGTESMTGMGNPKLPATPPPAPAAPSRPTRPGGVSSMAAGMAAGMAPATPLKPATPTGGMSGMGNMSGMAGKPPSGGVLVPPGSSTTASLPPVTGGGVYVQLGAVRSEVEAQSEWKRLSSRYPAVLGGLPLAVRRADLGDKGIYYRIQGGAVDEARARTICNELKAQNVGCQIVRP